MYNSGTEGEVELIDYLRVIHNRRKMIISVTVIAVFTAGIVSLFLPPRYEASAQIRIGRVWDKEIENPYLVSEVVGSDAFLARVIEHLNLSTTPYKMKKDKVIEAQVLEGGAMGQKLPLLLSIHTHSTDPQRAVAIGNTVSRFLIEEHQRRFEEKLTQYQIYEKDLEREVTRIDTEITDLEKMIKAQQLRPSVNAPSVILLQAQLEQKNVQLLNFKKELKDTKINNTSSIITENTKLVAPPVLPVDHVNPNTKLIISVAGTLALFITLVMSFFLEYLDKIRLREKINK